jgi:mono/diheme cytochrome c family protein
MGCIRSLAIIAMSSIIWAACVYEPPAPFVEAQTLGGESVKPATLNRGRATYQKYCAACHGTKGDGRGLSSGALQVPPRDFRLATYKFAGVVPGDLPTDEGLARIVNKGLDGTVMLHWDLPEKDLSDVLQYIKTFSSEGEGWRDEDMEKGQDVSAGADVYGASGAKEAINRGRDLYHGLASCNACHPSYVVREEINLARAVFKMPPVYTFRAKAWLPLPKMTSTYTLPIPGDPVCEDDDECEDDGRVCRLGRYEKCGVLIPPDFTLNSVRTGGTPKDIMRVVAAGIPGTAMPTWKGSIPDKDIWALAYYVSSLVQLKGSPEAASIRRKLRADTAPLAAPPTEDEPLPP